MKRVTFSFSIEHIKRLKRLSRKLGIGMSDYLRRLIDQSWQKYGV